MCTMCWQVSCPCLPELLHSRNLRCCARTLSCGRAPFPTGSQKLQMAGQSIAFEKPHGQIPGAWLNSACCNRMSQRRQQVTGSVYPAALKASAVQQLKKAPLDCNGTSSLSTCQMSNKIDSIQEEESSTASVKDKCADAAPN